MGLHLISNGWCTLCLKGFAPWAGVCIFCFHWSDIGFGRVSHFIGIFFGCRCKETSAEGSGEPRRHVVLEVEGSEVFEGLEGILRSVICEAAFK